MNPLHGPQTRSGSLPQVHLSTFSLPTRGTSIHPSGPRKSHLLQEALHSLPPPTRQNSCLLPVVPLLCPPPLSKHLSLCPLIIQQCLCQTVCISRLFKPPKVPAVDGDDDGSKDQLAEKPAGNIHLCCWALKSSRQLVQWGLSSPGPSQMGKLRSREANSLVPVTLEVAEPGPTRQGSRYLGLTYCTSGLLQMRTPKRRELPAQSQHCHKNSCHNLCLGASDPRAPRSTLHIARLASS